MHFGNDNLCPYTSLLAFMHGFLSGQGEMVSHQRELQTTLLVPADFDRFVARHFGYKGWGMGWQDLIPRHTSGEQAAFDLFFELVAACERQYPPPA